MSETQAKRDAVENAKCPWCNQEYHDWVYYMNRFFECKLCKKDFQINPETLKIEKIQFDNFEVITPVQFYKIWRRNYE